MPAPAVTKFGGDVRLWRKNANGSLTPVIPEATDPTGNQPVEANAMVFGREEGETVEVKSKRRGLRYGQLVYSEQEPGTANMSLTLLEVPPMIMSRVMSGLITVDVDVEAGSVTDAAVTGVVKDRAIQLPHRLLAESPAPAFEDGGVAMVEGTDYELDLRRGQLFIKKAGVNAGDTDITASYSYGAYSKKVIKGGGSATESFYVTGDMENRVTGDQGELTIWEFKAAVDGEVDLFGDEPISPTLAGSLVVPADKDAPYEFEIYKAAA